MDGTPAASDKPRKLWQSVDGSGPLDFKALRSEDKNFITSLARTVLSIMETTEMDAEGLERVWGRFLGRLEAMTTVNKVCQPILCTVVDNGDVAVSHPQ